MAQQLINVGAVANDGTGDAWRDAFIKVNANDTELFAGQFTNIVIVKDASSYPLTGADNTTYIIDGDVTVSTTFTPGTRTSIVSFAHDSNSLTYSGVGNMFSGVNKSLLVADVSIACPNGTLQDWEDISPLKTSVINYENVTFTETNHIGNCKNIGQLRYFACVFSDIKTTGHTFTGDIGQGFSVDTDFINNSAAPVYDLGTATFDLFWILDYQMNLANASGSFLSGLVSSGNINSGGLGQILIGLNIGAGTSLINISPDDDLWNFQDNSNIRASRPDALISMQANATNTAIAVAGTYVLVAGTWVVGDVSQFTGTTAGRMTYTGSPPVRLPITFSCSVEPVSGTNKVISLKVAVNGVVIDNSRRPALTDAGNPISITAIWQATLNSTDFVEIWVTNETDTIDVLVSSAVGRIN